MIIVGPFQLKYCIALHRIALHSIPFYSILLFSVLHILILIFLTAYLGKCHAAEIGGMCGNTQIQDEQDLTPRQCKQQDQA